MALPKNTAFASDLPPPSERKIVKAGLARVGNKAGQVVYDWEKIRLLWLSSPGPNFAAFCRAWDIPYWTAKTIKGMFKAGEKELIESIRSRGYREEIIRRAIVESIDSAASDAAALSKLLQGLTANSSIFRSYVAAKLTKQTATGQLLPNVAVSTQEVQRLADINAKAATAAAIVLGIKRLGFGQPDETLEPEPTPTPVRVEPKQVRARTQTITVQASPSKPAPEHTT